ncbi:MAG: hypothetical protein Q8P92_02970 [Candidatus Daviesbacteria bacterium]|nr:hypothetical protein [Candidatus Daviesbacteria bacterium]
MSNHEALYATLSAEAIINDLTGMAKAVSYGGLRQPLVNSVPVIVKEVRHPVSVEELRAIVNNITGIVAIPPQAFRGLTSHLVSEFSKGDNGRQTLHYDQEAALLVYALALTRQNILQAYPDIQTVQYVDVIAKTVGRFGQINHPLLDRLIPTVEGDIDLFDPKSSDNLDEEIRILRSKDALLHGALSNVRELITPGDSLTLAEVASSIRRVLVNQPDSNFRRYIFDIANHSPFGINISVDGISSVVLNAQGALALAVWVFAKKNNGASESPDKTSALALNTFGESHPWLKFVIGEKSETANKTENLKKINIQHLRELIPILQELTRFASTEHISIQKLMQFHFGITQAVLQSGLDALYNIYVKRQKAKGGVVRDDMNYKNLYDLVNSIIDQCMKEGIENDCLYWISSSNRKTNESV